METDFNYIYEDKKYEAAVRNLKATFFDIVLREEALLNNLEGRIAVEKNEEVKEKLLDLWSKQNNSLDESLELVQNLTASVRVLDSFIKELSSIDEKIVQDILSSTDELSRVGRHDFVHNEINSEEVNNEQINELKENNLEFDLNPGDVNAFEEVEVEEAPVPVVTEDNSLEEAVNVPEMEVVNEENDGMDLPYVVEPDNIVSVDEEIENSGEATIDTQEASEEIVVPFVDVEKEEEVVEEVPTIYEETNDNQEVEIQASNILETTEEINSESNVESNTESTTIKALYGPNGGQVKAIIVNGSQFDKLSKSLGTQEALLFARGIFDNDVIKNTNYLYASKNEVKDDNVEEENIEQPQIIQSEAVEEPVIQQVVEEDTTGNSEEVEIPSGDAVVVTPSSMEEMLEKANELYKAGKTEEAQMMYDQISEMNKSLQNGDSQVLKIA